MELCLVMPAYNEEGCIRGVVQSWLSELSRHVHDFRMIVVNDGSKDETPRILDELAAGDGRLVVVHQKNAGHGAALLRGYREAVRRNSDWVFQVDSDDQFKPADFAQLWKVREQSKFILGYRKVRHDAFHRLVITHILRGFLFMAFGAYIPDSNVPYRLIQGVYLRQMLELLPKSAFAPNIFLAVMAARNKQKLFSIPISHEDRKTGTVSIVRWKLIKVCFRCVKELANFRIGLASSLKRLGAPVNFNHAPVKDVLVSEEI